MSNPNSTEVATALKVLLGIEMKMNSSRRHFDAGIIASSIDILNREFNIFKPPSNVRSIKEKAIE